MRSIRHRHPTRVPRRLTATIGATALMSGFLAAGAPSPAIAAQPGDVGRFDTWVGYDVGRYPSAAAMADVNGDGALDVVWGMEAWAPNEMSVSINLGDGTLAPAVPYPAGYETSDLATADIDGDGDIDIVGAGKGNYTDGLNVDIWTNTGDGTFEHTQLLAGDGPTNLALADLDGDSDVDIVLANSAYVDGAPDEGGIGVLLNNGDGTFASEVRYHVGPYTWEVVLADADGDGILDAIATTYDFDGASPYQLGVLTGKGDGTFDIDDDPQPLDAQSVGTWGMAALAAGDMDADGDSDLVLGGVSSQHNAVLLNDGTGIYAADATYDVFGALSIRLVDVDTDDDLDVLSVGGGGGAQGSFTLQRNNGDGTLAAPEQGVTSNNPLGLAVGDLDRDGRVDLAIASRDTATGATHLQRADGTFAAPPGGSPFDPTSDVVTADLDGDGDQDVAAVSKDGFDDVVRVFRNDGTGVLTEAPFVRWEDSLSRETRGLAAGDLDGDGDQDLAWLVGRYASERVVHAMNTGDATFATPTTRTILTCPNAITIADVDADGDLDEVFGNDVLCGETQDQYLDVSVSRNDGSGTYGEDFTVRMSYRTGPVVAADVSGDGVVDLVGGGVENFIGGEETGDIAIAIGDGSGGFADGVWEFTGHAHVEFAAADFEGDGDLDIASNAFADGTVLLINDGTGTFTSDTLPGEYIHGYTNAVAIATGDVTGDSIVDIVVAHVTGSDVGVHAGFGDGSFERRQVRYGLRPRVADVELADLNGDGLLDIVSPATLGGGGIPEGRAAADSSLLVLPNHAAPCTIVGTAGADVLTGTKRSDVICGLGGDDVIKGRGGADIIRGAGGNDRLVGGAGIDVIDGGGGNDIIRGGADADRLRGGAGRDTLQGGSGVDVIDLLDGTQSNDDGRGGSGKDHCRRDSGDALTC